MSQFVSLTLSRDCLTLFRHGNGRCSKRLLPVPGGAQLFEGDSIFLNRYCREGACPVPFVWLVLVEKLRTRFKPLPCRSVDKRNFSERSASFLISTVGDERVW